jgi:hypothetical protein
MILFLMSLNGIGARSATTHTIQAMLPSAAGIVPADKDLQMFTRWKRGERNARSETARGMASRGKKIPEKRNSGVMKSV